MTILAIDDSSENLIVIKTVLEDTYELCLAKSGKSALKALERSKVDLILLDIQMPEMSGFELIAELEKQEAYKHIPVIFLTGTIREDIVSQIRKTSAKDFIEKPVDAKILKEKVAFFSKHVHQ
ncbi:MAG: response regulator [Treponema sp.]|jgi:putative two-component system response regulator|nr:response regulator [Treponema sp.]